MESKIKTVPYTVKNQNAKCNNALEPWDVPTYPTSEMRYCIVSTETGEILDDAQGYGYKTAQKAYAAYAYKYRDKSKDKERANKTRKIKQWMKENKSFVRLMDEYAFQIAKGAMSPTDKFDAKLINKLLKEQNLHPDFTAGELLKVWRGKSR